MIQHYSFEPTAARYFFKNGCVELSSGCVSFTPYAILSCPLKESGDIVIDRDYEDVDFVESDFYKFLLGSSSSNKSFTKKLFAIGYMLCNKMPKDGCRHRAFVCVNENNDAYANGKSLFTKAVAQFCNTVLLPGSGMQGSFWLSSVSENTNLLVIDDVPKRCNFQALGTLCAEDWRIDRKGRSTLWIDREKAPYILLSANRTSESFRTDGSFSRRFVFLEFSSFFGVDNSIDKYIGRMMFHEWDDAQWHMFDCFMLDCIIKYLYYSNGGVEDVFSFFS